MSRPNNDSNTNSKSFRKEKKKSQTKSTRQDFMLSVAGNVWSRTMKWSHTLELTPQSMVLFRHGVGLFEMALSVSILEGGSQRPYKRSRTMNTLDLTPQSMALFRHKVGRFGMGTFSWGMERERREGIPENRVGSFEMALSLVKGLIEDWKLRKPWILHLRGWHCSNAHDSWFVMGTFFLTICSGMDKRDRARWN